MNDDKKTAAKILFRNLQQRMDYKNPKAAISALLFGWMRHPRYPSITPSGIAKRISRDGHLWFKEAEIRSFEDYIGYPLR